MIILKLANLIIVVLQVKEVIFQFAVSLIAFGGINIALSIPTQQIEVVPF